MIGDWRQSPYCCAEKHCCGRPKSAKWGSIKNDGTIQGYSAWTNAAGFHPIVSMPIYDEKPAGTVYIVEYLIMIHPMAQILGSKGVRGL